MDRLNSYGCVFLILSLWGQTAWSEYLALIPADEQAYSLPDFTSFLDHKADNHSRLKENFNVKISKINDKAFSLKTSYHHGKLLKLTGSYIEESFADWARFAKLAEQKGALTLRWDSSLLKDRFNLYGQWDFGGFDPEREYTLVNDRQCKLGMEFKGKQDHFSYGAKYQYLGKQKENGELWGIWWYNKFNVKALISRIWDNLEQDSDKPHITNTKVGITLNHKLSSWPYLGYSLSYFQRWRQSSQEPIGFKPQQDWTDTVTARIDYSRAIWNVFLVSSISKNQDFSDMLDLPTTVISRDFGASYFLTNTLSIMPTLRFYEKDYSQDKVRADSRSASLTLSYVPENKKVKVKIYSAYDTAQNKDWRLETENIRLNTALIWPVGKPSPLHLKTLSLHTAYNQYRDNVLPQNNRSKFSIWLILSVQSPSGLRLGSAPVVASR